MTPKEKAEELVNKHRIILMQSGTDAGEEILCTTIAKKCALIAVDEIMSVIDRDMNYQNVYAYFLEVKQEIEKL